MTAAAPTDTSIPWRSRPLQAILASTLILPLGVPMLSPVLPAIRDHFLIGDATASLVMVVYYLPAVLLSPLLGLSIDRVGRRRVMVTALGIWAVAGLGIAVGPAFRIVLFWRVVQGATAAAVLIVTVTLIGDRYEGVRRNAVIGINGAVLFIGAAIAPLVGGVLVGYGWNVPFGVFVVGFPVAVFVLSAIAEPDRSPPQTGVAYLRGAVGAIPTRPAMVLYGTAVLIDFLSFGAILTAIPFILAGGRTDPVVIGAVITGNLLVGAVAAANNGRFAARLRNPELIGVGFLVLGLGLAGTWIATGPLQFGVAAAVFGGGYGLIFPSIDAAISTIAPSTYRGGALSLRNSATFLGRGTGPLAFTLGATIVGYRPLLAVTAGAILAVGTATVAVARR